MHGQQNIKICNFSFHTTQGSNIPVDPLQLVVH